MKKCAIVATLTTTPPQTPPQEQPKVIAPTYAWPQATTLPQAPPQAPAPVPPKVAKPRSRRIVHQLFIQGQTKKGRNKRKQQQKVKTKLHLVGGVPVARQKHSKNKLRLILPMPSGI